MSITNVEDADQGEYSFQSANDDQQQVTAITATLELTGGKVKVEKKKTKGKRAKRAFSRLLLSVRLKTEGI